MRKVGKRQEVRRINYQGLVVHVEFPKGSKRPYRDDNGKEHFKTMYADYGEVRGTEGLDGDPVDIYVGPDPDSERVFIVTQMKKGDWDKVDEEKCILGVGSKAEARQLYLKHYDDPRFCGAIKELSMDQFKQRLETKAAVGKKIASSARRIAEINYLRMQEGDPVLIQGAHGVATKVASDIDWGARFAQLEQRRNPDGGSTVLPGLTADHVDAFLSEYRKQAAEVDPDWKEDMPPEIRRSLKKKAPDEYDDRRRAVVAPPEINKDEQLGVGVPKNEVRDVTDSRFRKVAANVKVDLFLGKAAAADGRTTDAATRKRQRENRGLAGAMGALAGLTGGYMAGSRHMERQARRGRVSVVAPIIGMSAGTALGRFGGERLYDAVQGKPPSASTKKNAPASPPLTGGQKALRAGALLGGAVLGAAGAHQGIKHFGPKIMQPLNKQRALGQINQKIRALKETIARPPHHHEGDPMLRRTNAQLEINELNKYRRFVDRIPVTDFSGEMSRKDRHAALGFGAAAGGGAGFGIAAKASPRKEKQAAEGRAGRIADRLDDVGIGILASPYIAEGIAKRTMKRPGLVGRIGAGLHAYHDNFAKKNRKEIAGLALVAPGITHTIAKSVDRVLPGQKSAGLMSGLASHAASITKPMAGGLLKGTGKLVGAGLGVGALGVGGGLYGAKKLMSAHPSHGLSVPQYQPPRLF